MSVTRIGRRLAGVVVVTIVAAVAGAPSPAPAQAPPVLPVITLGQPYAPFRTAWVDCDGVRHIAHTWGGYVEVDRDDTGVVDPVPVAVGVGYSGDLADDLIDPASSDSVAPEGQHSSIQLTVGSGALGTLTVALEPGPGYTLGDPSSGSFTLTDDLEPTSDCTAPLALGSGTADQVIGPGDRPADLDVTSPLVLEEHLVVLGALPPGLALDGDGVWSGAATAAGRYAFRVARCSPELPGQVDLPAELCSASASVQILVEADDLPDDVAPSGPAAPATPVRTDARFTG
jgi:hypothetical protein